MSTPLEEIRELKDKKDEVVKKEGIIYEDPGDFDHNFREWKKKGKLSGKRYMQQFLVMFLLPFLRGVGMNWRERVQNAVYKYADKDTGDEIMKAVPSSISYAFGVGKEIEKDLYKLAGRIAAHEKRKMKRNE